MSAAVLENEVTERQEGEQSHIVGNQHRADKGDIYEGEHACARVAEKPDYIFGEYVKKVYVFESGYDGESAEKAGKGFEIEIAGVFRVGGDYDRAYRRQSRRNTHHGVLSDEGAYKVRRVYQKIPECLSRAVFQR